MIALYIWLATWWEDILERATAENVYGRDIPPVTPHPDFQHYHETFEE